MALPQNGLIEDGVFEEAWKVDSHGHTVSNVAIVSGVVASRTDGPVKKHMPVSPIRRRQDGLKMDTRKPTIW